MFMRTSPTSNHNPPVLIPSAWVIDYWLADANIHVLAPLIITTIVSILMPNIIIAKLENDVAIGADNRYFTSNKRSAYLPVLRLKS